MQRSAWISNWESPSEIALTGHSGSQAPQLMQASEILYAIHIPSIPVLAHFIPHGLYKTSSKKASKKPGKIIIPGVNSQARGALRTLATLLMGAYNTLMKTIEKPSCAPR